MEEIYNEKSEVHGKIETVGTDQITVSKETLINIINQQVMNKYLDHDYAYS